MLLKFLVYAAFGRVAIFFLQKFPFAKIPVVSRLFVEGGFLHDLWDCDLCLGFWVYTILAYIMQINLLEGWFAYVPLVSEALTGAVTSLIVHLVRIGWQTNYTETVVKME